jgi:HEAT repeat protein
MKRFPLSLILVRVLLMIALATTLLPGVQLDGKETAERLRVKVLIDRAVSKDRETITEKSEKDLAALTKESIPVLIEFALDQNQESSFREEALMFLKGFSDERILEPFTKYYRSCREKPNQFCEKAFEMANTLSSYYVRTKDARALALHTEMLVDDTWPATFKLGAVRMLGLCEDAKTVEILKRLVINNPSYRYQYHKAWAAGAIVDAGDDSVLTNVIEYANFMLDDSLEKGGGRGLEAIEGVRALSVLAKRNEDANNALQRLCNTFVTDYEHYYVYRDRSFDVFGESVVPALASTGRKESIRLIEQLAPRCTHQQLTRQMISVLGEVGDEETLAFLSSFGRYPDQVQRSIARIKERQSAKK